MSKVLVKRGGQITLTKDVREKMHVQEGDVVMVNLLGESALVSKRDPKALEKHDFLPENFAKTLKTIRTFFWSERLQRFGITG